MFGFLDLAGLNLQIQLQTNLPTGAKQGSQVTVRQLEFTAIENSDTLTL